MLCFGFVIEVGCAFGHAPVDPDLAMGAIRLSTKGGNQSRRRMQSTHESSLYAHISKRSHHRTIYSNVCSDEAGLIEEIQELRVHYFTLLIKNYQRPGEPSKGCTSLHLFQLLKFERYGHGLVSSASCCIAVTASLLPRYRLRPTCRLPTTKSQRGWVALLPNSRHLAPRTPRSVEKDKL